jgi:hypothetical protein
LIGESSFFSLSFKMLADTLTIYGFKGFRALTFRVAIDVAEKYWSSRFVTRVYVGNKSPPDLFGLATAAVALENAVFWVALTLTYVVATDVGRRKYGDAFFFDVPNVVLPLVFDYACCTAVILAISYVVSRTMQNPRVLRYEDDGMRAIRAYATFVWWTALATLSLPFYLSVSS